MTRKKANKVGYPYTQDPPFPSYDLGPKERILIDLDETSLKKKKGLTLDDYIKLTAGKKCLNCGKVLKPKRIRYYEHDGGWQVEGFNKKQWLYYECSKCGHQTSFAKLGIERPLPRLRARNQ